jgi:hypothetical protein
VGSLTSHNLIGPHGLTRIALQTAEYILLDCGIFPLRVNVKGYGNVCGVLPRFSRCSAVPLSRQIENTKTTDSCLWPLQDSAYKKKEGTTASCYYRNRLSEECVGSNVAGNKGARTCVLEVNWREENTAWAATTYAMLQRLFRIPNVVRDVSIVRERKFRGLSP